MCCSDDRAWVDTVMLYNYEVWILQPDGAVQGVRREPLTAYPLDCFPSFV